MKRIIINILRKLISEPVAIKLVNKLAEIYRLDFRDLFYAQQGILKYQNEEVSGEKFFIDSYLSRHLSESSVVFDVGANIGNYALSLGRSISSKNIYCFEPNPYAYALLVKNTESISGIKNYNFGLGDVEQNTNMYIYGHAKETEHGSVFKSVLDGMHHSKDTESIPISISTLDHFCAQENINQIDFLKIDTEGFELSVLKGGEKMLESRNIKIIQFEFNEMNVASRVYLKDFFELLDAYDIYRLDSNRLIHLPFYDTRDEIFQFQNFIALLKPNKATT